MPRFLKLINYVVFIVSMTSTAVSFAGDVEIVGVKIEGRGGQYTFHVTLMHEDTGWDHYANIWRVEGEGGEIYGTRVLAHPHVNEQPFTRSLSGVEIPEGIKSVTIRAGENVGGLMKNTTTVVLPQ